MWPQRVVADGDRTLGDVRGNRPIANERLLGAVPCPQGAALRLNLSTDSIWICSTLGCTGVGCFPNFHTHVFHLRGGKCLLVYHVHAYLIRGSLDIFTTTGKSHPKVMRQQRQIILS